jgi:hypothetical protein
MAGDNSMTDRRQVDGSAAFAIGAVTLAVLALLVTIMVAVNSGTVDREGDGGKLGGAAETEISGNLDDEASDNAVADPTADGQTIVTASSVAMARVTSVQFTLTRSGAPIFIDQFERIALESLLGRFTVPNRAQAELTVKINDNLTTKLGAVAIDEEVWISNPVTGDFETLPDGYDIDPSRFFDPTNGWNPLLANLQNVELIRIDDRRGDRYHIRGTAPAAQVRNITVGLVRSQDVPVDLWIHPQSKLVTSAEFSTVVGDAESNWALTLTNYGDTFTINPPENVKS